MSLKDKVMNLIGQHPIIKKIPNVDLKIGDNIDFIIKLTCTNQNIDFINIPEVVSNSIILKEFDGEFSIGIDITRLYMYSPMEIYGGNIAQSILGDDEGKVSTKIKLQHHANPNTLNEYYELLVNNVVLGTFEELPFEIEIPLLSDEEITEYQETHSGGYQSDGSAIK